MRIDLSCSAIIDLTINFLGASVSNTLRRGRTFALIIPSLLVSLSDLRDLLGCPLPSGELRAGRREQAPAFLACEPGHSTSSSLPLANKQRARSSLQMHFTPPNEQRKGVCRLAAALAGPITAPSHYVPSPGENMCMLSHRSFQLGVVLESSLMRTIHHITA